MTKPPTKRRTKKRTNAETAAAVGVSERTVNTWGALGCDLTASIEEINAWREANIHPRQGGIRKGGQPRMDRATRDELDELEQRAKTAKLVAESRGKAAKRAVKEGAMIEADDAELVAAELAGRVRARLESMPYELETEWPANSRSQTTAAISGGVYNWLLAFSQGTSSTNEPVAEAEATSPADLEQWSDFEVFEPPEDMDPKEALQRAKIAKLQEETKGLERANQLTAARLLAREFVDAEFAKLKDILHRELDALPDAIAAHAPPEQQPLVADRLREKVSLVLRELDQTVFPWMK